MTATFGEVEIASDYCIGLLAFPVELVMGGWPRTFVRNARANVLPNFYMATIMDPQTTFLSTAEVLDLLKCSKTALRNLIKFDGFPTALKFSFAGQGPSRTTTPRYPKTEVEAWIRDKAIEAQGRRNQYVAAYPPLQLCKIADIDSALFYMRGILNVYDERKRVFGKVRSDLSHVAARDLPWGEIKDGIAEMLMQVMQAASALGIDVEGMVKS